MYILTESGEQEEPETREWHTLFCKKEQFKLDRLADTRNQLIEISALPSPSLLNSPAYQADMITLKIDAGKKQKIRAGDILGALTGENGIEGNAVGKIALFDFCTYVAINRSACSKALKKLEKGKIKGRSYRVRKL